jgi:outer membrane lipoprotein-sorting protein
MKRIITTLICLLILNPITQRAGTPSAEEILQRVDNALSPTSDFTMNITATEKEPGQPLKVTRFKMLAKGQDQTLLMTLSPDGRRGRNLLYNALDLWVYLPSVRRPFRISLQERLTGEAANADLARANYSRDYTPALTGTETVGGMQCYRLDLSARSDSVPYHKVAIWARVADFTPVRAEFYAVSGRLIKECLYEQLVPFFETRRPTRLVLKSAVSADKTTILEYSDWKEEPLPMKFFDKSYIDKTKY